MQSTFEVLWWAPYLILVLAAFPAFSGLKLVYRLISFRHDREVVREMAKSDPHFEKVLEALNPKQLLFDALLCFAMSGLLLGIAIYWSRAA